MRINLPLLMAALLAPASAVADTDAILKFVNALPPQSDQIALAAGAATSVEIGDRLEIEVDVRQAGYLSAVVVSQNGDVTFIGGRRKAEPGKGSLWSMLGVPQPTAAEPWGHEFIVVLHDPKKAFAAGDKPGPVLMAAKANTADLRDVLTYVTMNIDRKQAASLRHVVQTEPRKTVTRGLTAKARPERPVWIPGTQGAHDNPTAR